MLSRVADSLYWMSRYMERAEHVLRLLSVRLDTMVEDSEEAAQQSWLRLVAALGARTVAMPVTAPEVTRFIAFDRFNRSSVLSSIASARDNARAVREQISSEMWEHLNRLYLNLMATSFEAVWAGQASSYFRSLIDSLFMFQGITHSTMRHGEGWHFIELGRYIERAQLMSRLLDVHFGEMPADAPEGLQKPRYFDWISLLKQCAAFEAYCRAYTARIEPNQIADFLVFDPEFPHALRFGVNRIHGVIEQIGTGAPQERRAACLRLSGRLKANLEYGHIEELLNGGFDAFLDDLQHQCGHIHFAVHNAYIAYGVDGAIPA